MSQFRLKTPATKSAEKEKKSVRRVSLQPLYQQAHYIAHCVHCAVYFSAQPNKLRPILKLEKYYPIEQLNIYLSQLVRVRGKYTFLSFSDFQTLDP